jgi:hypothetical protein
MFIGLNPSTADERQDDPTIRHCVAFAKKWGYGALCMANLFAFRATQPKQMMGAVDPVGRDNDRTLRELSAGAGIVIAGWGNLGAHRNRAEEVRALISRLHCLKQNANGAPAHPLYLKADTVPYLLPP